MKVLAAAAMLMLGLLSGTDLGNSKGVAQGNDGAAQPDNSAGGDDGEARDEAQAAADGRAILEDKCARCHAIGKDDTSRHAQAPPFREVVTRYPPEDLAEALAEGIVSGHPDMPEFVFQPNEIEAIITYLGTLTPAALEKTPPSK
jgi:mono/diheme cytochrome c family protein